MTFKKRSDKTLEKTQNTCHLKSTHFRNGLYPYVHRNIKVRCSDIGLYINSDGLYLLLLKEARIAEVDGHKKNPKNKRFYIHHTWVRISEEDAERLKNAKTISISGVPYTYRYSDKTEFNVGIRAERIFVIQPRHHKRKPRVIEPITFSAFHTREMEAVTA